MSQQPPERSQSRCSQDGNPSESKRGHFRGARLALIQEGPYDRNTGQSPEYPGQIPDPLPGAERLAGPLLVLRRAPGMTLGEDVTIRAGDGMLRHGQIAELDADAAVIQVYEGTAGLDVGSVQVELSGDTFRLGVSGAMLGRVLDGRGRPIDDGPPIVPLRLADVNGGATTAQAKPADEPADEPAAGGPVDDPPVGTATEQPATAAPEPEIDTGVSFRDVAFAIECDDKAATVAVRRWSKSGKIKAKPIGKCPLDGRAKLYRLFEILIDIQKILSLAKPEVEKYRQVLVAKQRPPQ